MQAYFKNLYNLELSVRPVHKKWMEENNPYIAVNSQIQSGVLDAPIFLKKDITETLAKYKKEGE